MPCPARGIPGAFYPAGRRINIGRDKDREKKKIGRVQGNG
jgi:hypothetical protein